MADEVAAEPAARLLDTAVRGELDQVGRLVVVQLVAREEAEPDGRRGHALLEVAARETEAEAEELDEVVVPGGVVDLAHGARLTPG